MRLSLGASLVSGAVFLSQASAWAADTKTPFPSCTTTPTEADRKAAQGAFAAGQGSFNEADYSTAITYWRDAYKRDCTAHPLLLNLARAYELRGDRAEAINALETYLQRKPDDSNAEQIRRRIENLKAQIAATAATATPPPAPASTAPPPPPAAPTSAVVEASSPTSNRQVVGPLLVGGGGLVLTLIGAGVYSGGAKKVSDAEEACPNHKCKDDANSDLGNQGLTQKRAGGALIGVGLAAVAGGVVWYLVSANADGGAKAAGTATTRTMLLPTYSPGFAGLALSGGF